MRDGARTLGDCLEALFASRDPEGLDVIVVDDGSRDDSLAIARRFPCLTVPLPEGRGPAAARNAGAEVARSERLVFVDADVLVAPDTIR